MQYPVGEPSFEALRMEGYVYVDKTEIVYDLTHNGKFFFLSRPRRFGKSLLISTLQAYFEGRKDLFEGLKIAELEQDWVKYPVLHLDLNTGIFNKPDGLVKRLDVHLSKWESLYGISNIASDPDTRFEKVIEAAYEKTGKKVVVLVDEYDKPLFETIGNQSVHESNRELLRSFYSIIKSKSKYLKFVFLTGITKFGKLSVFSGLNNLEDISLDEKYATICGISETELHSYFDESVALMAAEQKMSKEECYAILKEKYDGYHFAKISEGVYNPFSLLNAFKKGKFASYWHDTGMPTILVNLFNQADFEIAELYQSIAQDDDFNQIDDLQDNPISLFYQTGYLTIKGYKDEDYILGFPNKEVEKGFLNRLANFFNNSRKVNSSLDKMKAAIKNGRPDDLLQTFKVFTAGNNYQIAGKDEINFQNVVGIIFRLLGANVRTEDPTSCGRIDMVIETPNFIYVIEFKLNSTPEEALAQIEDKEYALKYSLDPRKLFKIGVNFSSETRNITDWKIKEA